MATRFYFPSAGAAAVAPTFSSSWHKTSDAQSSLILRRAKSGTAMTTSANIVTDTTSGARFMLARQFVSDPLVAQTISGSITGQIRCIESNAGLNATLAIEITVWNKAGTSIVATLLSITSEVLSTTPPEFDTSLINRPFQDTASHTTLMLTNANINAGDRIVIEIGYRKSNTTANRHAEFRYGDAAASDLGTNSTETNDNNPWIEFSGNLVFDEVLAKSIQHKYINLYRAGM